MTQLERPIVQEAHLEGHVEIDMPASNEALIVDDEIATAIAEDILRIVEGHESDNEVNPDR